MRIAACCAHAAPLDVFIQKSPQSCRNLRVVPIQHQAALFRFSTAHGQANEGNSG